jgi:hypothetical protein
MVGAVGSAGSAPVYQSDAGEITKQVTDGEMAKSEQALKIVKANAQVQIAAGEQKTAEDALALLLG